VLVGVVDCLYAIDVTSERSVASCSTAISVRRQCQYGNCDDVNRHSAWWQYLA